MIKTKNAYYLHVPKTAGTWMYEVLEPIVLEQHEHGIPEENFKHDRVYAFVRNPWDWYASMYNFLNHGSDLGMPDWYIKDALLKFVEEPKSFDNFLYAFCKPTDQFKNNLLNYYSLIYPNNLDDDFLYKTIKEWCLTDVSFYDQATLCYTKFCTKVGRYETIQNDLLEMLTEAGDITPEVKARIENYPKVNVTSLDCNYKSLYNNETRDLVETTSSINKEYKYRF